MKKYVIGVTGPSASGKTTITRQIAEKLPKAQVTLIKMDSYYLEQNNVALEKRMQINYDHPNAFDMDLLYNNLKKLIQGEKIKEPIYNFTYHTREKDFKITKPTEVIIVEGILIFQNKKIRDLLNMKIYVQTDSDLCLIRRIQRDIKDRDRTVDQVIEQYLKTVKPMQEEFIEPTKKYADFIIPNSVKSDVAIEMISQNLNLMIEQNKEK